MILKRKPFAVLLAMAAALSFTGCSDEVITDGGGNQTEGSGDFVHVSAAVALPSGTRSATDEPGKGEGDTNSDANPDSEYGYDYENDVRSMLLVIANTKDEYITHTVVNGITEVPSGQKFDFLATGEIQHTALVKAYEDGLFGALEGDGYKANIYAYCNYTGRLLDLFEGKVDGVKPNGTNWINWSGQVEENASPVGHTPAISNTIWASRSFLMTNASKFEAKFPKDLAGWEEHTDKAYPYPVGKDGKKLDPIQVERAAARIDFRDGSKGENGTANTYKLMIRTDREKSTDQTDSKDPDVSGTRADDAPVSTASELNLFNVKLTRMALVNMSKDFYYLRRVSMDGQNEDSIVGGIELPYGVTTIEGGAPYVVDVDAKAKREPNTLDGINLDANSKDWAENHFNFPLFKVETKDGVTDTVYAKEKWYADRIDDVLNGKNDTWGGENQYKIWRYVTENTIPQGVSTKQEAKEGQPAFDGADPDGTGNQQTIQSTGVVFKASIQAGDDIDKTYMENSPSEGTAQKDFRYVSTKVRDALKDVKEDKEKSPILYSYSNMLYAGINDLVRAAVMEGQGSPLYLYVDRILSKWSIVYTTPAEGEYVKGVFKYDDKAEPGTNQEKEKLTVAIYYDIIGGADDSYDPNSGVAGVAEEDNSTGGTAPERQYETIFGGCTVDFGDSEENIKKEAPKNNIAVYEPTDEGDNEGWGYYCYYFYWNRHNDNSKSGKMGPMEFATVRNNVYKLAVTKVGQLGHPTIPSNDPDPVKPDDPDEDPKEYIEVQVEVLPWVVRVNDIEF